MLLRGADRRGPGRGRSMRWPRSPAAAAPTTCSWPRADHPTGRSRPRPSWPGTAPGSSTSARPSWTCRGTPTTTRNSTSGSPGPTGPGRYDDRYELEGIDYPAGYVRWTERRNLECFLDLLARKEHRGRDAGLRRLPDGRARAKVYADLTSGALKAVGVLLEYPAPAADAPAAGDDQHGAPGAQPPAARADGPAATGGWRSASSARATTRRSMLLPHLARLPDARASRTSRPPGRCPRSTPSGGSASPPRRPTPTPCSRTSRWTRSSS